MAKRRARPRLQRVKRSFVVTLSAAGASGLIGAGCSSPLLGPFSDDDGSDPKGRPPQVTAGIAAIQPEMPPPLTPNPPYIQRPIPQPWPASSGGTPGPAAGAGGSINPPPPAPEDDAGVAFD